MTRLASRIVPAVTVVTVVAVLYLLLSEDGWRAARRLGLAAAVALFVAVAFSQAAALAQRGLESAATVLLWSTLTACAYFLMFSVVMLSD